MSKVAEELREETLVGSFVRGGVESMGASRLEAVPPSKLAEQSQRRLDNNDFAAGERARRVYLESAWPSTDETLWESGVRLFA